MPFQLIRRSTLILFVSTWATAEVSLAPQSISPLGSLPPPTASSPMENSSRPGYNPAAFNPSMGLTLDVLASQTRKDRGDFDFRSAELNLLAAVDPFANLYAVINGTPDEVEVEEAAFMTTSLPFNLTVRGGRFFANFGRFPHWHDHELPFVNRTESLETFFDGEARADGVELLHLFKTPFFLQGTIGAYKKLGAENSRLEETTVAGSPGHENSRGWNAFTYLGRLFSYVPLGDDFGLDLGLSAAVTPTQYYIGGVRQDRLHSARSLTGADVTFRWEPLANNVYRRLLWGTEIFRNDERRRQELALDTDADGTGDTDTYDRRRAYGGYSYVDWRFAHRWSGGGFVDLAESIDAPSTNTKTVGVTLNFLPSDFQRIRLQLSRVKANDGTPSDSQVFLQWFGAIGRHVHVFKDR